MTDEADKQNISDGTGIPDVDHQLCVHTHLVAASCSACMQSCPRSAWIMDDDALGIDVDLCDGCAICVAACPEAAIRHDQSPAVTSVERPEAALIACSIAVPSGGQGVRACLNAVSLDELADLYTKGVRQVIVCREDCAACERGTSNAFDETWRALERLIDDRGLAVIEREEVAPTRWRKEREQFTRLSRRSFLMALRPGQGKQNQRKQDQERQTAADILSKDTPDAVMLTPFTPQIDTALCTACDACSRICPHGSIAIETTRDGTDAYRIVPTRCTGCRMCIDVCDVAAVEIIHWQHSARHRVFVDSHQCTSCGNVFRNIANSGDPPQVCTVCASSRHNAKLYQVLE